MYSCNSEWPNYPTEHYIGLWVSALHNIPWFRYVIGIIIFLCLLKNHNDQINISFLPLATILSFLLRMMKATSIIRTTSTSTMNSPAAAAEAMMVLLSSVEIQQHNKTNELHHLVSSVLKNSYVSYLNMRRTITGHANYCYDMSRHQ